MVDYLDNHTTITENLNRKRKLDVLGTSLNDILMHSGNFSKANPLSLFEEQNPVEISNSRMYNGWKYACTKKRKAADEMLDFCLPESYRSGAAVDLSSSFQQAAAPQKTVIGAKYISQPQNVVKTTTAGSDGDYQIVVGEHLNSMSQMYEVLAFLGRGTFGQVVKCRCRANNRMVAIKILKNHPSYLRQGNVEIQILQTLSQEDTESHNIVRAIECFQHKNHMCLVFELLEQNLYEYLKSNKFRPMTLPEIRPIAQQVLSALAKLRQLQLIHADLKPENIMLVNPTNGTQRFQVKVIDFGSACVTSKAVQNTYLQSRYYRAPEILLGLPFNESIDMWSLGCVLAELFLGWPLYPGSSEYDQIRYIVETQGLPPNEMLKNAGKVNRFFVRDPYDWRLKRSEEYLTETGQRTKEARKYVFGHLDQIRNVSPRPESYDADYEVDMEDRNQFASLLIQMLQLRPEDRISPDAALNHSLITMNTLQRFMFHKRVRDSVALMQVCYRNGTRFVGNPSLADHSIYNHLPKLLHNPSAGFLSSFEPSNNHPTQLMNGGSGSNHNTIDLISPSVDQYFLDNLAAHHNAQLINAQHNNNAMIAHNRMIHGPQMSLYDLVAAGNNALSILAAASQPTTGARDLLHQALLSQQQQQQHNHGNNLHHDQSQVAAATAAAALVLSHPYSDLSTIQGLYQKTPVYMPTYSTNYPLQNQMDNFIPDPTLLTHSIPAQLMQNCGSTINWLEKSQMNLSRQSNNNHGPFNPFVNNYESKPLLSSALGHQTQINMAGSQTNNHVSAQNPYFLQHLMAGFDRPATNELGFSNTIATESGPTKASNRSLTALQQMLTSQNASFLNSVHSHQSQMAAALEVMQQQNQRELSLSYWNIPNTNTACIGRTFLNDSLPFPSTNNEISSYFNLLSKSNQESFSVDNGHSNSRSMLFNQVLPNHLQSDLKHILPALTAIQSSEKSFLPATTATITTTTNPSVIIHDPFTMKISENNTMFRRMTEENSSLGNHFHLKKFNEPLDIHNQLSLLDNTGHQHHGLQTHEKILEYLPYSESKSIGHLSKNGLDLVNAMQYHLSGRNNSFTNVSSNAIIEANINLTNDVVLWSIENGNKQSPSVSADRVADAFKLHKSEYLHGFTDTDAIHVTLPSDTINTTCKKDTLLESFYATVNKEMNEAQNDIKFNVSSSSDYNTGEWNGENRAAHIVSLHMDECQFNKEMNTDAKFCQQMIPTKDSGNKDKKNVPVGRVQPMIKEERQSINNNTRNPFNNTNTTNTNNNTGPRMAPTMVGLNGRAPYKSSAHSHYNDTSLSHNKSTHTHIHSIDSSHTHNLSIIDSCQLQSDQSSASVASCNEQHI